MERPVPVAPTAAEHTAAGADIPLGADRGSPVQVLAASEGRPEVGSLGSRRAAAAGGSSAACSVPEVAVRSWWEQ